MIRIHAPLPRFQSLRMQLSSLSWQRGISNFFLEGVPFSFSVGKELADQITQSLVFAMKEMSDQKKQFSVLEFGAGLGGLSKHVLDLMKIHHPDYYARCTFHITDASEEIVKQIQSSGLFADHKDRILCYPLGFGALPKSTKIDFVFMSYLLDSLASRMIEVKNNQIYEVLVTTVIPKETRLFDTAQLPPRVLSPESIRRAYQDADKETLFRISSKLARILKEQWVRIPLDKSTMRDADKREIRRYVSKMPEVGNIRFNYSPLISQGIRQIVSRFGDFGLGFIFDFGSTRPQAAPKPGKLVSKYGVTAFSNVSFPYLTFLCESEGCEVSMSTFKEGNSQLFWFHKGLNKQRAETSFKLLTLAERGTLIRPTIKQMQKIEAGSVDFEERLTRLLDRMPAYERENYNLILHVGAECFGRDLNRVAEKWALKNVNQYPDLAVTSYYLLGEVYAELGEIRQSEAAFKKVLSLCPDYANAYKELYILYSKQNRLQEALGCCRKYLCFTLAFDWEMMLTNIVLSLKVGEDEHALGCLRWIRQARADSHVQIPEATWLKVSEIGKLMGEPT